MPRLPPLTLLALVMVCASCTPTLDPVGGAAYYGAQVERTDVANATQVAAIPITESAANEQFNRDRTATHEGPSLTSTAVANQQAIATLDAAQTKSARDTFAYTSTLAHVPTAISATGTALAVASANAQSYANTRLYFSYAVGGVGSLAPIGLLIWLGIWLYKKLGQAHAEVRAAEVAAENNKPQVFEDLLVYPSPSGVGYIHQRILKAPPILPSLPPPAEIQERIISGQTNGKPHFITKSEPVNQHEKLWREVLATTLFHARECESFASTELAGLGKLFSSNDHWQRVTDVLRDNDLILKDNGGKTVRAGEWTDIISRVQDATKPLRLPARIPPRLRPIEVEKVV